MLFRSMDVIVPSGNPATNAAGVLTQSLPVGSFSFTSKTALVHNSITYAAGSNLLSGTYTNAKLIGSGTSGGVFGNTSLGSLVFTSDFLNFSNTTIRDFSISVTSINAPLFQSLAGNGKALRTFRGFTTGSFSTEPPVGVPEPQVWGLLVIGFGLIGVQVRRRNHRTAVAA